MRFTDRQFKENQTEMVAELLGMLQRPQVDRNRGADGQAVNLFTAGYQKAIQMQVYDEYTAKIREALGRLASDKFPPERESRQKERIGDRPPTPEIVTEVAR